MKWNVLSAALVVGVGVCSQSFGFELLDRMLGTGCGCAPSAAQACCEKPCGVAADPGCGCAVDPGCGCAMDAGCGCADACGCQSRRRPRLLDSLFCGHRCRQNCGCGAGAGCGCAADAGCGCAADPGCGCAAAATCGCASAGNTCCKRRHRSLLDSLFCCRSNRGSSCGCGDGCAAGCAGGCGCGGAVGGAVEIGETGDDAPMPPAPMADPAARLGPRPMYLQTSMTR